MTCDPLPIAMKTFVYFLALWICTLSGIAADTAAVQAADDARVAAMTNPDRDALEAIFSEDLRYSHSNGKVDTKASFVEALTSGKSVYAAIRYHEREFTLASSDIALMTGKADFHFGSADAPAMVLGFLAVWRLEEGVWRFLAWQSYKVPVDLEK